MLDQVLPVSNQVRVDQIGQRTVGISIACDGRAIGRQEQLEWRPCAGSACARVLQRVIVD